MELFDLDWSVQESGWFRIVLTILLGVFALLIVGALATSFHYNAMLQRARTPEEIRSVCMADWYKNSSVRSLPAQCLKFYTSHDVIPL